MYELIRLSEHDYIIDSPAKVGVVVNGQSAVLIDAGSDKDAGKKILRVLDAQGWHIDAVFCTHSHADHIGGCRLLRERTGCKVYANGIEADFTRHPILEPYGLIGAYPYAALRHKFLLAEPCDVLPLSEDVLPDGMKIIPLPGHSFDMVGFLTSDSTAFIADSVSSEETLAKYGIGVLYDVAASLETLASLGQIGAKRYVPAHAAVTEDISPLAAVNADAIRAVVCAILDLCRTERTFESLLKAVFESYGLTMTVQQHALIGSTVRSYLSYLADRGEIACRIEDNEMLWQTASLR